MDIGYQFTQALGVVLYGVTSTVSMITSLLAHYGALSTFTSLILIGILVSRLFSKFISSGSSDKVRKKKENV